MATMNISLPDEMKAWVEEQVATGAYAGASDVVRDAVRDAQQRRAAIERINAAIQEGIDSGIVENYDPVGHRRMLRERLTQDQKKVG